MVKKAAAKETPAATLGAVVMIYTKSSSHWTALLSPSIIEIEGYRFIEGTQVTGKVGHKMEGKRTLIPLEHVASITEFAAEEDLWSEPQPRHIRATEETAETALLTSHEQPHHKQPSRHHRGGPHRRHRHQRGPRGHDSGFQDRRGGFDREPNFNR